MKQNRRHVVTAGLGTAAQTQFGQSTYIYIYISTRTRAVQLYVIMNIYAAKLRSFEAPYSFCSYELVVLG